VAFGNDVWSGRSTPPEKHHDERDFARLADWGMDAVRFYLNYQLFESDAQPGQYRQTAWDWLDRNIAWAKRHRVRLILNVHVPPGGFQSNGAGDALWNVTANQDRFVLLWKAIAEHCRNEPTIAGYDLLNEPHPVTGRQQWADLAARITAGIRQVDGEHMIFVERTNAVGSEWANDANMNFFLVPDPNVVYEFHFYSPIEYTHQQASWTGFGEGGPYPDDTRLSSGNLTWYDWSYRPAPPPQLPAGDSDWAFYESMRYEISDPAIAVMGVVLVSELNLGTVYFDDVVVKEYDPAGALVRTIFQRDLESTDGWSYWTAGTGGTFGRSTTDKHSGSASLYIANTNHDANATSSLLRFIPKQGNSYSVGGWMKGVGISNQSRPDPRGSWTQNSRAMFRFDYLSAVGPVRARNVESLAAELDQYVDWGKAHDVPLYLGEFGAIHYCFEQNRGGTRWVSDMLDLTSEREIHFTYHAYHESAFGIFLSDATTTLPDMAQANLPLVDTLRQKLTP
jgi:endoglucanase